MTERELHARVHQAVGEPPAAGAAVHRLEAAMHRALEGEDESGDSRRHPGGMTLLAGALAALLVVGLLAVQAAESGRLTPDSRHPGGQAPASPGGCLAGAPNRLIVVHLATQELVAYDNGCPFLNTPVTTGRPSLATPTGKFHVLRKVPTIELVPPWPKGSPNWYPVVTVHDYLGLTDTGLAIHSAEWEPASAMGPGSQNGSYGTHGDVNVGSQPLRQLYDWAPVGTTVIVDDGPAARPS